MTRTAELLVLGVAAGGFLAAVWAAGPSAIDDAPLDLGAGISMAPGGRMIVTGSPPVGPMRIPEEHEYFGTHEAAAVSARLQAVAPARVSFGDGGP